MASGSADAAGLRHLHTLYRVGVLGDLSDAQLLERYVAGLDEGAEAGFAALVERHGPMVLRVCRQILGDPHDAEDAFQATFLVLARRAGSVRRRDSVASWLHGIARRVAMHARSDVARRRRHERQGAAMRDEETRDEADIKGWPELHEELARLPSTYRESVVLCYMEGLTTAAAARRLGCAQGTVLARLSRARARLRRRLIGRGLAPSAGLLMAGTVPGRARGRGAGRAVSSVMTAAMKIAAGKTAAGVVPSSVMALAEGVLSMLFRSRLRGMLATVAAFAAVALGIGMLAHRPAGRPQVCKTPPPRTGEGEGRTDRGDRRPGRRHDSRDRGRAVHGPRGHRPGDRQMADDLPGRDGRHGTDLARRPLSRLLESRPEPPARVDRHLDLRPDGQGSSAADLRAQGRTSSGSTRGGRS